MCRANKGFDLNRCDRQGRRQCNVVLSARARM